MRCAGKTLRPQRVERFLPCGFQQVDPQAERRGLVVQRTDGGSRLFAELVAKRLRQPLGMAVAQRQVGRFGRAVEDGQASILHRPRNGTQHAVGIFHRALVGMRVVPNQGNGLGYGGVGGDAVKHRQLVHAEIQAVPHTGQQARQADARKLFQVKFTQGAVLQHAECQPGSKRGVPAVQPRAGDIMM